MRVLFAASECVPFVKTGGLADVVGELPGYLNKEGVDTIVVLPKYSTIPQKYLDNLELKEIILEIADDLFNDCKISEYGSYHDEIWEQKYIYKTYARGRTC